MFTRTASAIFLCIIILSFSANAAAQQTTVFVLSFENETGDRNIDWIGPGVAELLIDRLGIEIPLYVFGRDERTAAYDRHGIPESVSVSRATALKLAWDTGADVVITGSISGTHEDFHIEARVLDVANARFADPMEVSGKLADVISLSEMLAWQLGKELVPSSVIPLTGYTLDPPVPGSAFEAYTRGMLASDSDRRIEFLQEAIAQYEQYEEAIYQLGRTYHFDADLGASIPLLETITENSPYYGQAQFFLGLNYYSIGDFAKAASIFTALPATYDALINLGVAASAQGDPAGAFLAWQRAADREPLRPEAFFNMGYLAFVRNEMREAAGALEQFLKLHGRDGEGLFLLGRAYASLGRTLESQRLIAQAIRLDPRVERWVTQPLANLQRLRTEPDPTESRLGFGITLWTRERVARRAAGMNLTEWLESVQTHIDSLRHGDAIRELLDITGVFPDKSAEAYLMLARSYQAIGQAGPALQAISSALRIEPDNRAALDLKFELEVR